MLGSMISDAPSVAVQRQWQGFNEQKAPTMWIPMAVAYISFKLPSGNRTWQSNFLHLSGRFQWFSHILAFSPNFYTSICKRILHYEYQSIKAPVVHVTLRDCAWEVPQTAAACVCWQGWQVANRCCWYWDGMGYHGNQYQQYGTWISLHSWQGQGNGKAKDIKWPEISLNLKNTSPPPSIYNKQYGNGSVTCISFLKYPFDICFVMIYHHVTSHYRELPNTNEVTLPSG